MKSAAFEPTDEGHWVTYHARRALACTHPIARIIHGFGGPVALCRKCGVRVHAEDYLKSPFSREFKRRRYI